MPCSSRRKLNAVLFSILRDISRKNKVKAAFDRLQRLGVPVLGAVVTGAPGGLYGNDYYDSGLDLHPAAGVGGRSFR